MSLSEYEKVFSGSKMMVIAIKDALATINIVPVIKDTSESARLGGFGPELQGFQDVYLHKLEVEKAQPILDDILNSIS